MVRIREQTGGLYEMFRCTQDSKDRSKSMHVRRRTRSVTGPMPIESERPALSVDAVAAVLRTTPTALRRSTEEPDWPSEPASPRSLRWTEGQIGRLLWAPQDHKEHEQKA